MKKLTTLMLWSLISVSMLKAQPEDFQINKNAPPAIQAMLAKAKARAIAEKTQPKTAPHVEGRILHIPEHPEQPEGLPLWATDEEVEDYELKQQKERLAQSDEYKSKLEELSRRKAQIKKAREQMNQTAEAIESMQETLDNGYVSTPSKQTSKKPEIPKLPFDVEIPEPVELPKVEPPPLKKLEMPKLPPPLPRPKIAQDDRINLFAAQTTKEKPLPEWLRVPARKVEIAESVEVEESVEIVDTPKIGAIDKAADCPEIESDYRFSFSANKVMLLVNELTFEIEIIDGAINIQEVK